MPGKHLLFAILALSLLVSGCAVSARAESGGPPAKGAPTEAVETAEIQASADPARSDTVPHEPPESCPVTLPQDPPFTAPAPYSASAPFTGDFWYGSDSLWTVLPKDGAWYGLPHNPGGYTQKVFWWSHAFSWKDEPQPELVVSGERLDAKTTTLSVSRATNASADDIGTAMLVGVNFPTLGCWKITGQYRDVELSFVVWVAP